MEDCLGPQLPAISWGGHLYVHIYIYSTYLGRPFRNVGLGSFNKEPGVYGFGSRVSGFGFRVSGSGFRV